MGWIEAASQLLDAIAWPVSSIVMVLIFRKRINQLIDRVRAVRTARAEIDFGELLAEAEVSVDAFLDSTHEKTSSALGSAGSPDDSTGVIPEMPEGFDPSGVVLASWERLVRAVESLQSSVRGLGRPSSNVAVVLSELENHGVVNHLFVTSVLQLRDLRNRVAHALATPTQGSALAYSQQAEELRRAAETIQQFQETRAK